jgi:outer membrane protein OmpA-like peptidoglycan-associated protein
LSAYPDNNLIKEEQKMTNKMCRVIKIGLGLFIPFLLIFTGCGPSHQEMMARDHLANAKTAYANAKADPDVEINAQVPLMDAGKAVEAASQAKEFGEMDHLAYLAERKTQIAVATAEEQMAENDKKALAMETEQLIVQGREHEQRAKMDAMESDLKARESNAEAWFQTQKAEEATAKADKLQQEIAAMNGRMTERGIVLTIGDVLFTTGTATLSPKADYEINRLAEFMKEYPDRNVLIEGYTDSTGTEGMNLDLSMNRANAVSNKLVAQGISSGRITTKGLGEESPVAGNDTAAGREQNRRVDVIILNEGVNPMTQSRQ